MRKFLKVVLLIVLTLNMSTLTFANDEINKYSSSTAIVLEDNTISSNAKAIDAAAVTYSFHNIPGSRYYQVYANVKSDTLVGGLGVRLTISNTSLLNPVVYSDEYYSTIFLEAGTIRYEYLGTIYIPSGVTQIKVSPSNGSILYLAHGWVKTTSIPVTYAIN